MKQKVSDYIADQLANSGIREVFTVTGGGAMHLNDALGHHGSLRCTYHHHEQACAMAAEAYARVHGDPACVCVTTGPGATNAITGVLGAYMGSIPMLVLSGQARFDTTVEGSGLPLRSRGVQECRIIPMITPITKYAALVKEPEEIRYHLEKALYLAKEGRPGPVWLDIPLNVQGARIRTDELPGFEPDEKDDRAVSEEVLTSILEKFAGSERPVIFGGFGVRLAKAEEDIAELTKRLGAPVVTGVSSVDLIPYDDPLFVGRIGPTGDRAGNFAMQKSDLFFSAGSRLGYSQTGFQLDEWAEHAFKIAVDIDPFELQKLAGSIDLPVTADAKEVIRGLNRLLAEQGCTEEEPLLKDPSWRRQCAKWKEGLPVVQDKHRVAAPDGRIDEYAFYDVLSDLLPEDALLCVSVGTCRVIGSQVFRPKRGQRFLVNANTAAMGYDLPAVIGTSRAAEGAPVFAVTGDGSMMMNLQELMTIKTNRIPMKLFVINNKGYQSIRTTQKKYFEGSLVGTGQDSGDLDFPSLSKLAETFGFDYCSVTDPDDLAALVKGVIKGPNAVICEIEATTEQKVEPKVDAVKLENGQMRSGRLDAMAPFLPEAELPGNALFSEEDLK